MQPVIIRPIQQKDNATLATIIRTALEEFGANKAGTVYFDASTDELFELFQHQFAAYQVVIAEGGVMGGAGIYPTTGLPHDTCELVKMYLKPEARGKGLATLLMNACLAAAVENGFSAVYIETMPELAAAVKMYERFGFTYLAAPLGDSGHIGCDIWMIKRL